MSWTLQSSPAQINSPSNPRLDPIDSKSSYDVNDDDDVNYDDYDDYNVNDDVNDEQDGRDAAQLLHRGREGPLGGGRAPQSRRDWRQHRGAGVRAVGLPQVRK